jgi:aminopeptidase YwaD
VIRPLFTIIATICILFVQAQKLKKEDKVLLQNLQTHIAFLSSDKLEGRRTGTEGEKLAAMYIMGRFVASGLQPKGTDNFYQAFEVNEGKQVNASTHFIIDGTELEMKKDYFPLDYSANGNVTGMPSVALQENGAPWFLDVADLVSENRTNPHFDLDEALAKKISAMHSRGATAVIVYNSSQVEDGLAFNAHGSTSTASVPVVYMTRQATKKYLSDSSASLDIQLRVDISPKTRKGINVIGYIDNKASETIVLGAHFDHLGWGEDNNSMYRGETKQIHNGADDNASGTAALIELARILKAPKYAKSNYLFIAFSGEELGLFGSKYFAENPTINLGTVNYMINMDMVGRLNDSSHIVTVGGYGTTPTWGELYHLTGKKKLYSDNLAFRFDSSGTGPSDHTSFYRKGIPVLFYFTGLHADYHKPTDDADKINYTGEMYVIKHITSLIEHTESGYGKLAYTKTRETSSVSSASFSVTLGIMPDYTWAGSGVRVDGVSANRPAEKAGLKTGDVIIYLGENKISSLENYMQALGKFKKGDKTVVGFKRGNETLSAPIEF